MYKVYDNSWVHASSFPAEPREIKISRFFEVDVSNSPHVGNNSRGATIILSRTRGITFLAHVSSDGDPKAVNVLLKLDGESFHFWQWININGVHGEDRELRNLYRNRRYHWHRSNWHWIAYYVHDEAWPCLPNNHPCPDNTVDAIRFTNHTRTSVFLREEYGEEDHAV